MLDAKQRQNWTVTSLLVATLDTAIIKTGVTGKRHVITRLHYLVHTAAAFNVDFKPDPGSTIIWRIPSTMANNNAFAIAFEQGYALPTGAALIMETTTPGAAVMALVEGYTETVS